jgi:hypothetical protein
MSDDASPLNSIAATWREMLFPNAKNEQFADAYAQTVTFALLLARIQGAGNGTRQQLSFDNARRALRGCFQSIRDILTSTDETQDIPKRSDGRTMGTPVAVATGRQSPEADHARLN